MNFSGGSIIVSHSFIFGFIQP